MMVWEEDDVPKFQGARILRGTNRESSRVLLGSTWIYSMCYAVFEYFNFYLEDRLQRMDGSVEKMVPWFVVVPDRPLLNGL